MKRFKPICIFVIFCPFPFSDFLAIEPAEELSALVINCEVYLNTFPKQEINPLYITRKFRIT